MTAPRFDSTVPGATLVRAAARLLPASHRDEWAAEWLGELESAWRSAPGSPRPDAFRLRVRCLGAFIDAFAFRLRIARSNARRSGSVANDVRFAVRSLRRTPTFSLIVVATLGLCIGATTAVFSVVHSVLLDDFGYQRLDRLAAVWSNNAKESNDHFQMSVGDYADFRARNHSFGQLAAFFPTWNALYAGTDGTDRLDVGAVSANFLRTLGASPLIGRDFVEGEDRVGAPGTVILSYEFWNRALDADPNAVGKSLTFDGKPYVVIGVMGPRFVFPQSKVDVLLPLSVLGSYMDRREVHLLSVVGRLRDGATIDAARRDMLPIARQLLAEHPKDDAGLGVTVRPLSDDLRGDVRRPILLLIGAVCAVLLIGCANVTNLMLGRAWNRRSELAIRAAMGAESRAIARQLLVEAGVVALSSAAVGIGVAIAASRTLASLLPASISRMGGFAVDGRVLAFAIGVGMVAALLCGLAPAVSGARTALAGTLADTSRGSRGRHARRVYDFLIVGELAMALVLAVSAGLLISSFARLTGADAGFRRSGVVRMRVALPGAAYPPGRARAQYYQALLDRVRALPGVRDASIVNRFPLHDGNVTTSIAVEGAAPSADGTTPGADIRIAGVDYFRTMGIPVVAGRAFAATDADSNAVPVLMVNETAARKLFGTASPIGKRVTLGGTGTPGSGAAPWMTVVGVVGDVRDASLRQPPRPQVFLSATQAAPSTASVVVRYDGSAAPLVTEIRRIAASVDKSVPLFDVQTIDDVLDRASMGDRFTMTLLSGFAFLALLLAAIGTYGVMASRVSDRTHEIGVRMALGARAGDVFRMVLRDGALLFAVALPVALAGVWATTRTIQSLLFGVEPGDPKTLLLAVVTLAGATAVACWVPARRAARVDPTTAIRGLEG